MQLESATSMPVASSSTATTTAPLQNISGAEVSAGNRGQRKGAKSEFLTDEQRRSTSLDATCEIVKIRLAENSCVEVQKGFGQRTDRRTASTREQRLEP